VLAGALDSRRSLEEGRGIANQAVRASWPCVPPLAIFLRHFFGSASLSSGFSNRDGSQQIDNAGSLLSLLLKERPFQVPKGCPLP